MIKIANISTGATFNRCISLKYFLKFLLSISKKNKFFNFFCFIFSYFTRYTSLYTLNSTTTLYPHQILWIFFWLSFFSFLIFFFCHSSHKIQDKNFYSYIFQYFIGYKSFKFYLSFNISFSMYYSKSLYFCDLD